MATTAGAARRGCRTGLDLRRADWLVGRRPAGGTGSDRLSGRQDRALARLVGGGAAPSLSFLLVYGISEPLRGLGIADRGKPRTRQVLRCIELHIDTGSGR